MNDRTQGMNRSDLILLLVNAALIVGFGSLYVARQNYEFIIYVGVIIAALAVILISRSRVDYTLGALVGLTGWSALHMAGGSIHIGETRLYEIILVPLSDTYPVWRYDQLVHIWGFAASTLVMYCLLKRALVERLPGRLAVSVVLVMAGLGVGAFNEIIEFGVSICVPESGVGGYLNTSLDLCADLIGAVLGVVYVQCRYLH